jgi:4-diphosphocytidyl-2-C-methyl-D-erythritol kinase
MNTSPQKPETGLEQIVAHKPSQWRKLLVNDFEGFAFKLFPQIDEMKSILYKTGAIYSSMSGSGSTIYGIFERKPEIPDKLKEFVIYAGVL